MTGRRRTNNRHSKRLPVIELLGPIPDLGREFCATCCALYLGEISIDPGIMKEAQERAEKALKDGQELVPIILPDLPHKPLRTAVTTAVSVYIPYPAPVCWVHLQGGTLNPEKEAESADDQRS